MISEKAEPFPTRITEESFRTLYRRYREQVYAVCHADLWKPETKGRVKRGLPSIAEKIQVYFNGKRPKNRK